jgi:catecholate siderophore receptor
MVVVEKRRGYETGHSRTATKTDLPLLNTPQAVSVVTKTLIADQAMQNMGDVVRYVPGITMGLGEGHRDQPTIRGQSTTADFFVNGVRDDAQYQRDLYNVERVEALKGANAMTFGRGGGGGVINRVMKSAGWSPLATATLEGGSFAHRRLAVDANQPLGSRAAVRLNAMNERTTGFRDFGRLERTAVNPTASLLFGSATLVNLGYEHVDDDRLVDRGIPSGASSANRATFFGDPSVNRATLAAHNGSVAIEHVAGPLTIRNTSQYATSAKFYQNAYAASAVNGQNVNLAAYNNRHDRRNTFNQTDLIAKLGAHTLLLGGELGWQGTDNFRNTGYFGSATTLSVPVAQPSVVTGVAFRQSATDANNIARVATRSLYVQDQVALGSHVQATAGVRADRFAIDFHNNRNAQDLARTDNSISPRLGLVVKPASQASLYATWSVSNLPSSGDQFSSLTATTATLEPERFTNREVGAKWDVVPSLSLTAAAFQLDRTNSTAQDPADASRVVQTGAQRSTGIELGLAGDVTDRWQLAGGWARQRAEIRSATTSAKAGATVPLVPRTSLSLWNKVQLVEQLGAGLGVVHQTRMYAAVDNSVTLPAFTRVDGALFVTLNRITRIQLNVEKVFDANYFASAQGNNNIMPGAPRTCRLSLGLGR